MNVTEAPTTAAKLPLTFACGLYDRMLRLYTGEVQPRGIDLKFLANDEPRDIFDRMGGKLEFDASEMSSSEFISRFGAGHCPFVAIPAFASRLFRHGFIFFNRKARIRTPNDLEGKRVGVPLYTMSAAIWIRGLLQHEYGVDLSKVRWVQGALRKPGAHGSPTVAPLLKQPDIEINRSGDSLSKLLADGEIDAVISSRPVEAIGSNPDIARLFPNYREVEKDYYRRTRIFPIMHLIVIRRDVHEANPFVAQSLYDALCEFEGSRARADEGARSAALHAALASRRHGRDRRRVRRRSLALWRGGQSAHARGAGPVHGRTALYSAADSDRRAVRGRTLTVRAALRAGTKPQPVASPLPVFGRPNAASISRRTFTARSCSS